MDKNNIPKIKRPLLDVNEAIARVKNPDIIEKINIFIFLSILLPYFIYDIKTHPQTDPSKKGVPGMTLTKSHTHDRDPDQKKAVGNQHLSHNSLLKRSIALSKSVKHHAILPKSSLLG